MVRPPRGVGIALGYIWVSAMAFGVCYPLVDLRLDGWEIHWISACLIVSLVGSLIGVGFNLRHRNDQISVTGRIFNLLTATMAFGLIFITLPLLYSVSPVSVMVLLLAALLAVNIIWSAKKSPLYASLPLLLMLPLVLRYGFHWLIPVAQSEFWRWAEPAIVLLAMAALQLVHRKSNYLAVCGHRAIWIWLHSLHSVWLGLVLLALQRGAESSLVGAATNRANSAAAVLASANGTVAAHATESTAESNQDAQSLIYLGGGLAIASSLGMAVKGGLLGHLLRGERVDPIGAVAFGMLFLAGIWTLFARDVSIRDRQLGAVAGLIWGLPMLFILVLTLLS